MTAPIGPGDWVECVDDRRGDSTGLVLLRKGALYRIKRIGRNGRKPDGRTGLTNYILEGIVHPIPGCTLGFDPNRFRPIYRPKADLIESLKAPPKRTPREVEPA